VNRPLLLPHQLSRLPFHKGEPVRTKVATLGDDDEGNELEFSAGARGRIEDIEDYGNTQGIAYTVWIPLYPDDPDSRGIVNVFDEEDGPITDFLETA